MSEPATLLIVDDQPLSLKWLHELFKAKGYKVLLANSGELALQSLPIASPDLILLDVLMPGMDGFEVCQKLKADQASKDIPVIFLSALESPDEKIRGFNLGAVDFIQKPFSEEEALLRVQNHLELRRLRLDLEAQVHQRTQALEEEIRVRAAVEHQLRDSLEQNRLLMRELQHRVKNNLIMVISLLQMAQPADARSPETDILKKAEARILSLVRVYELLYRGESLVEADFSTYTQKLVESWKDIFGCETREIELECRVIHIKLPTDVLIPLGLMVNELLTNAMKYAFPDSGKGRIQILLDRLGDELKLTVKDNGCGFPPDALNRKGLGWELVSALSAQIRGRWVLSSQKGTCVEVIFPLPGSASGGVLR